MGKYNFEYSKSDSEYQYIPYTALRPSVYGTSIFNPVFYDSAMKKNTETEITVITINIIANADIFERASGDPIIVRGANMTNKPTLTKRTSTSASCRLVVAKMNVLM